MRQDITWYLVGDASRARIFRRGETDRHLRLLREFEHSQSRAHNRELVSDRPGRTQQATPPGAASGASKGNRSAMEPHTTPKAVEHEHFAHELAKFLHQGLVNEEYADLVLVAGPQFLGLLRNILDEQVVKHVRASVDKDYTYFTPPELEHHLGRQLGDFALQDQPSP